jgi:FkbM family methyltransferase
VARPDRLVQISETSIGFREMQKALKSQGLCVTDRKFTRRFLSGFKFKSKLVIDVGIRTGTPELYKSMPEAEFLIFEPDPDCEMKFRERFKKLKYQYFNIALGASDGALTLRRQGGASTFSTPFAGAADNRFTDFLDVPVRRLDQVLDELGVTGQFGLKIDTEGFEYPVLLGAGKRLRDAEFVIAELDVLPRFKESVSFSQVVALLAEAGLELVSILNERPGIQAFYDCLFIQRSHPAFANRAAKHTA